MHLMSAAFQFLLQQEQTAFDPKDVQCMSRAFDDVCAVLDLSGGAITEREAVAIRIIQLARWGERSPTKLRDCVLAEASTGKRLWSGSSWRK